VSSFEYNLQTGLVAESAIAKWIIDRGGMVLPAYQVLNKKHGGPRLFTGVANFVTPDMLVFGKETVWIEAKHKTAFTWHRITERFVTGVDICHWKDYLEVKRLTGFPCWLLFNHTGGQAKDSPPSPSGLFGGEIGDLKSCINHSHANWGRSGMVYWAIESLKKLDECLVS
jgi:hypothetical protein